MEICNWYRDDEDSDTWESNCGVLVTLNDGTPYQNDMRYCYKCGKPMFKSVIARKQVEPPASSAVAKNVGCPPFCNKCSTFHSVQQPCPDEKE